MKNTAFSLSVLCLVFGCTANRNLATPADFNAEFTVAFGSCNRTNMKNLLWDDIAAVSPDVWIWGGDNIYADTDDIVRMQTMYRNQNQVTGYRELKQKVPIIGTWDDHDYGLNDGGVEFPKKKESQQAFLDFMEVPMDSPRRSREGVYTAHDYNLPQGKMKILVLDTRYFRTPLTPDTLTQKRVTPNTYGQGTLLGEKQWQWLSEELHSSQADFNIIISSIQLLSNEHGFECWGNFPHETDKLLQLLAASRAKGVMILSGDRHISEFSRRAVARLSYPLIDFTSSGLTHVYASYSGEPNPYRVGEVVAKESFGLVKINLSSKQAHFEMIGNNGEVLGRLEESY